MHHHSYVRFVVLAAIAALLCGAAARAAPPANVEHVETFRGITQYRLKSNGMTILLAPDRTQPGVHVHGGLSRRLAQ